MKLKNDIHAQLSTELILILSTILIITLLTAQFSLNYQEQINNHTQKILNTTRNTILSKI